MLRPVTVLLALGLLAGQFGAAAQEAAPPSPPPSAAPVPAAPQTPPAARADPPAPGRPAPLAAVAEQLLEDGRAPSDLCWSADGSYLDAQTLVGRTLDARSGGGIRRRMVSARFAEGAPVSGSSVFVLLSPEPAGRIEWPKMTVYGAARSREPVLAGSYVYAGILAQLRRHEQGVATVEVDFPDRVSWRLNEDWTAVLAVCETQSGTLVAFGAIDITVRSRLWSALFTTVATVALYGLLGLAALQIHGGRLRRALRLDPAGIGAAGRRWRYGLNPLFISQDASGEASLARFQLLAFTFAVVMISIYVFCRTDSLAALSDDVLKLLGITVLGSGFARAVGDRGSVSTANRLWLKGNNVIASSETRLPVLRDLVCADGEVDISRVQALVFSALTIGALIAHGARNLGGFQISDQTLYLLGISQFVFVAGKALPAETVRRLNQELDAVRTAERALRDARANLAAVVARPAPADAAEATALATDRARAAEGLETAKSSWNASLTAVEGTLTEIYGTGFNRAAFNALRAA